METVRLLVLSLLQSFCLAVGQVFLKLAMVKMRKFEWSWAYFGELATNWWLLAVGVSMGAATVLWMYLLKRYELSIVHPLTCISYFFSIVLAMLVFHEAIPLTRWVGVACIMVGMFFILK